jgi:hypothetical protein
VVIGEIPNTNGVHGIAIAEDLGRGFISAGRDNSVVIFDLKTLKASDAAAFDPEMKTAFSSNGEGNLTVISEDSKDKFSVAETVATQRGARTMSLDAKTHKLYLPTAQFGETPAPTAERPRPRPAIVPNSFVILVYGK